MWDIFGDFNEGHVLWLGGWSSALVVALALGVALVLVLSYFDLREVRPRWRAFVLLSLRGLVLGCGLLLLLEPALELRDVERERNHVAVLSDGSRSMDVNTPDSGRTRRAEAARVVSQLETVATERDDQHVFDYFVFGEDAERTSAAALERGELPEAPDATRTRAALETVVEQIGRARLAGVVLVSDGIDSGALGGRNRESDAPLDPDTVQFIDRLGVPIHVFAASPREGLRDVAIEEVLHDQFAFVRNRVAFDVTLRGLGVSGTGVQVELYQDGERIRSRQVAFESDDDRQTVTFEVVPEKLGKSVYSVIASPVDGEAIEENNRYHFTMKVIRDKIRVLQVCGRPSWDERFLRRLLKENPNVDLISFFILRTNSNVQLVPQDELSLIPFPKDELFDQELPSFDLVIFQNFDFGPYVLRRYLDRIEEFVRGGGGFLMIGGDLSFSNGGYAGTPIGELLPVELFTKSSGDDGLLSKERFEIELSETGRRHPITRLSFDPTENARLWDALPPLEGTNIIKGLRAGATPLAFHPSLRDASGEKMPVIAVGEWGDGRTMAYTTDSSWLWAFEHTGEGGTPRPYTNLWNNAIRWLIQDPELKLINVELQDGQVTPGQPIAGRIEVLKPDYAPAAGASGTYRVVRRGLEDVAREKPGEVVLEEEFETDGQGAFALDIATEGEGVYTIEAEVEREHTTLEDRDLVLAVFDSVELRDVAPRNELLRKVARASGGRFAVLSTPIEVLRELEFEEPRVTRIRDRKLVTLWDTWIVFAVIASLLAAEWLLRRRWGRL